MNVDWLFYSVVDAVQAEIELDTVKGIVEGGTVREVKVLGGVSFKISLEAISYFLSAKKGHAGVVFHVAGDLYLIVAFNNIHSITTLFVVSGKSLGVEEGAMAKLIPKSSTITEAVEAVKQGIKKSFFKKEHETKWTEFKYASPT